MPLPTFYSSAAAKRTDPMLVVRQKFLGRLAELVTVVQRASDTETDVLRRTARAAYDLLVARGLATGEPAFFSEGGLPVRSDTRWRLMQKLSGSFYTLILSLGSAAQPAFYSQTAPRRSDTFGQAQQKCLGHINDLVALAALSNQGPAFFSERTANRREDPRWKTAQKMLVDLLAALSGDAAPDPEQFDYVVGELCPPPVNLNDGAGWNGAWVIAILPLGMQAIETCNGYGASEVPDLDICHSTWDGFWEVNSLPVGMQAMDTIEGNGLPWPDGGWGWADDWVVTAGVVGLQAGDSIDNAEQFSSGFSSGFN